jgi:flagellar basal body-associated protein FliL
MGRFKMSETKPSKVVRQSIAITLVVACILLIAGLGGAMAYYTKTINDKYNNYASSHSYTNDQYVFLNSTLRYYAETHYYFNSDYENLNSIYENYVASHGHSNSEYDSLQSQVNNLTAAELVSVNLLADDNRTIPATPFLHVHGYVVNFGTNTAYGWGTEMAAYIWVIYVVGYQSGGVEAIHTLIYLPNISGRSWISVDSSLYYNGSALVSWNLNLISLPTAIGG